MSKTLIAFFSRADENYFGGAMRYVKVGNTEIVVNSMKDMLTADIFKIEMKEPYSPVYMTCIDQAKKHLRSNARPELVSLPLEAFDFSGKTILPFCTNEGSGMGKSEKDIKNTCNGANVAKGLAIRGSKAAGSETDVKKWLAKNGVI